MDFGLIILYMIKNGYLVKNVMKKKIVIIIKKLLRRINEKEQSKGSAKEGL
jgi:uncharacterized membrane protein